MQIPRGDERRLNLIGGQWVPPSTEKYEPCLNPADTREVLGHFPRSGAADAKAAVDAATKAFPGWAATPGPERGRIIGRALSLLKARVEKAGRKFAVKKVRRVLVTKDVALVLLVSSTVGELGLPLASTRCHPLFFFAKTFPRRVASRCGRLARHIPARHRARP